jgi:predicted nucleic acid-binding protein
MNTYLDTGVLLPLYIEETFSERITKMVEDRSVPIPLNLFQEMEFENATRLKVFRGEITQRHVTQILKVWNEDIGAGRLIRRPVNWVQALDEARRLGTMVSAKTGCRTLDLVHVAIAVKWGCEWFVTADERQLKAADAAGLKVLDVRKMD